MRGISAARLRSRSLMSGALATIALNFVRLASTLRSASLTAFFSISTSAGAVTRTRLRTAIARSSTAVRTDAAISARLLIPLTNPEKRLFASFNAFSARPDTTSTSAASRLKVAVSFVRTVIRLELMFHTPIDSVSKPLPGCSAVIEFPAACCFNGCFATILERLYRPNRLRQGSGERELSDGPRHPRVRAQIASVRVLTMSPSAGLARNTPEASENVRCDRRIWEGDLSIASGANPFVEKLEPASLGFEGATPASTGRPITRPCCSRSTSRLP
ncbi:hypothetical protein BVI2075_140024 [Burkholderia vietnamiensis]|nr:hypothetical protein BVI2075_140024 [Burkholderia vietnamiensis]